MNHFKKTSKKLEKLRGVFFQLGLLIACGLSLLAFEWTFPTSLSGLGGEIIYEEEWENPVDPFDIIEEEVEKEKIIEKPKVDPLKFEIVPNEKKVPKEEPIEIKKKEIKKETKKKVKKKKPEIPIFIPEKMPEFDDLFKYLGDNLKYPKRDKEVGIQGTVYLQFIVGKNGEIRNVKILRGVSELIDKEALRVVKAMPKWKPGIQNDKPVSVIYNLPIKFIIKG
ncbi:MAG: energy transducer TonB [Flavobacteriales bacterium]|nr:energy transducer TonB [Flavobacteriales bacterium]